MFSNDCTEENIECKIFCHGHCRVVMRKKNTAREFIFKIILKFHFADALGCKKTSSVIISPCKKIRIIITETSLSSHTMQGVRLSQPRTWLHTRVKSESLPNSQMGVCILSQIETTSQGGQKETEREASDLVKGWQRRLREHEGLSLAGDRGGDNPLTRPLSKDAGNVLLWHRWVVAMKMLLFLQKFLGNTRAPW